MKNKWELICRYINRRRNGAVLTRQKLIEYLWEEGVLHLDRRYMPIPKSVDTYRNYLTKAGFLTIIRPGRYLKVKTIPRGISRRDVQRLGYDVSNYHQGW